MKNATIGILGTGPIASNLSRILSSRGYGLALYHPDTEGNGIANDQRLEDPHKLSDKTVVYKDVTSLVTSLTLPRILFVMEEAGDATEGIIQKLLPVLSPGDVLIDGGNSHYEDTSRRCLELESKGIHFLGCGFSGDIEAAWEGPAIMAGGSKAGYGIVSSLLEDMAAKAVDGSPCCIYVGPGGAGHFVKIVHNGLEYTEMQLIAEVYSLLRWAVGLTPDHISEVLAAWKETEAYGYLLDITTRILKEKQGDQWVIDTIVDSAGHRGTGVRAVQTAATFGIPAMMISAALHARHLSGQRRIRVHLDEVTRSEDRKGVSMGTTDLFNAYQLARIINYHEGFSIIRVVSGHFGWDIHLEALSRIWTNGCIIRSVMMNRFVSLWEKWDDELILHPDIKKTIASTWPALRRINQLATSEAVFTPCLISASQYIAGGSLRFPIANLIQAQRDYFGSHGFLKIGDSSGELHHFPWNRE